MSKLRAIDTGTIYDVQGKLRGISRQIERGEHGKVTEAVLVLKVRNPDEETFHTEGFLLGFGTRDSAVFLLEKMKSELL